MSKRSLYNALTQDDEPSLAIPNFQASTEAANLDPLMDTQIIVNLDSIKPFEDNPRTRRNPKYDEIKESIRSMGLLHRPNISRRPGDDKYMIVSGGNTRLAILNELWQETHDPKFWSITCLFVPWKSATHALAAHIVENDTRGDISFIERARAIHKLKLMLEADQGTLSQRALAGALNGEGVVVSHGHISRMFYALEHLEPALPLTLGEGLGKPQVEWLIRLRNACAKVYALYDDDEDIFAQAFGAGLAEHDAGVEAWQQERVQAGLVASLAGLLGVAIPEFSLQLDTALAGRELRPLNSPAPVATQAPTEPEHESWTVPSPGEPAWVTSEAATPAKPEPAAPRPAPPFERVASPPKHPGDITALRQQCFELASEIARHCGFAELILPSAHLNGFLVELPAQPADLCTRFTLLGPQIWWMLFGLTEQLLYCDDGRDDFDPDKVYVPVIDPRLSRFQALRETLASCTLPATFADKCLAAAGLSSAPSILLLSQPLLLVTGPQQLVILIEQVRALLELRMRDPKDLAAEPQTA